MIKVNSFDNLNMFTVTRKTPYHRPCHLTPWWSS